MPHVPQKRKINARVLKYTKGTEGVCRAQERLVVEETGMPRP